ncbi:MAG: phosphate ABC transporter substrate-binding protein PstS [Dehalococcoidia bacterium]|nr:phosphate ABC transporter substrate-binding protein PstS [Dehalococcoidia bacterium]
MRKKLVSLLSKKSALLLLSAIMMLVYFSGCGSSGNTLYGTGATFPEPLYKKWFTEYEKQNGVRINYEGTGSGSGISAITAGLVDFGASDGILTDQQLADAFDFGGNILSIPMTAGAVAVIYNISGVTGGELILSGQVLADIYEGVIKKWNDTAITDLNPNINLPNQDILVVRRSDSSGTTNIFTNYLSKVSESWLNNVGTGNSVNWPVGLGGEKNGGVAEMVKSQVNSIGYVELAYAVTNNLNYAKILNKSGNAVLPSAATASAAAKGITLPNDMRVMVTDSSDAEAYSIVGFTWVLVYANQKDEIKGKLLVEMLWWAIHQGQEYCEDLYYARLSNEAVAKAEDLIKSISYDGTPLHTG